MTPDFAELHPGYLLRLRESIESTARNLQVESRNHSKWLTMIDNGEWLKVLRAKGVTEFFHANSVRTSCTFLEAATLLSRGYVEKNKLKQTPQDSDELDKKFGIWNDIFLDGVDVHERGRNKNHYGPVLFVLNPSKVLNDKKWEGAVRITRENLIYWKDGQTEKDRYFESADEFSKSFWFGDFGKHFTFRPASGRMELAPYLEYIVLDDPQMMAGKTAVYDDAFGLLTAAAKRANLKVDIRKRTCGAGCKCLDSYRRAWAGQKVMFEA